MVAVRDLDADLILLDFWGTWCDKCITSIPHLRELQSKLGGKRLQVVGVACEQTQGAARTAKVNAVVKKLDINYTVLITTMDGTCPVQDAFQIRYYPTMILLDRNGRILCRAEGATTETLARIDRYIAKNLDREPSTRSVAVGGSDRRPAVDSRQPPVTTIVVIRSCSLPRARFLGLGSPLPVLNWITAPKPPS